MSFRTVDYDHFRSASVADTADTAPWWEAPVEALAEVHVRGGWVRAAPNLCPYRGVALQPPKDPTSWDRGVLPCAIRDWSDAIFPTAGHTADFGTVSLGETWIWSRSRAGVPRVGLHRDAQDGLGEELACWVPAAAAALAEILDLVRWQPSHPVVWDLPRREWSTLCAALYTIGPGVACYADGKRLGLWDLVDDLCRSADARRGKVSL